MHRIALSLALLAPASAAADDDAAPPSEGHEAVVRGDGDDGPSLADGRAKSEVKKSDLDRRLPRSAPDALRYEPGVFVQQTGHGQGSAFVRGLTGQQTVLLFDGIRLNNSTYRQGPNQYFFTLDARTIDSIEVLRGGGSTEWGSDALGGVILARPIAAPLGHEGFHVRPSLAAKYATADEERGGRLQLELGAGPTLGFVGGVGARRVGFLESAGPIEGIDGGEPLVPRFEDDGRTQLGTGFDELAFDGRTTWVLADGHALTAAAYGYRQYDAPRTDQCPAAFAPFDECLTYEEQFRTLAYLAYDGALRGVPALRATASYQLQHERRNLDRPRSFTVNLGRDDVETLGVTARATSSWADVSPWLRLRLHGGADLYRDELASSAWLAFTDVDITVERSRGQYLDGSTYLYGGAWTTAEAELARDVTVRAGARVSQLDADAPGDPDSGSEPVDLSWTPVVGHAGVEWRALEPVTLLAAVDRSFRAPNLDDLTSRQQTGPGFQFENAALEPETALTREAGVRLRTYRVELETWVFQTDLDGAIVRQPRDIADCPPGTPQCGGSWARFQLVNATGTSSIHGAEASARLRLPLRLTARGTVAYAFGEGPNPAERPGDPDVAFEERVPLSRIPPLNGTAELDHRSPLGFTVGAALRWAKGQDRLAVADVSDARIPPGGTPGFAVVDARASWRWREALVLAVVAENVFDEPYRYHGSSINGPGRGLVVSVEAAPF